MKVHVAYSRHDVEIVMSIVSALRDSGIVAFTGDDGTNSGSYFAETIIRNIQDSECVLFFQSANAAKSQWLTREIRFACSENKRIITVKLDESGFNSAMVVLFPDSQVIRWNPQQSDECIITILHALYAGAPIVAASGARPEVEKAECCPNAKQRPHAAKFSTGKDTGSGCSGCLIGGVIITIIFVIVFLRTCFCSAPPVSYSEHYEYDSAPSTVSKDSYSVQGEVSSDTASANVTPGGYVDGDDSVDDEYGEDSDDYGLIISATAIITFLMSLLLCWIIWFIFGRKRKFDVKFGSNFLSVLNIDGEEITSLIPYKMHTYLMKSGHYLVDFVSQENRDEHQTFNLSVGRKCDNYVFAERQKQVTQGYGRSNTIKIFIAGSLELARERDALRSVISIMYNKWQSHDFRILSYTFEDFSNKFNPNGGQQTAYDEFIENDADWAVFVIDGHIGGITHSEFDKAMDAHKQSGKPNILVLSHDGTEDTDEIREIRNQINCEHQYWTPYSTIQEMKMEFESALNWDLIEMTKNFNV